MAEPLERTGEFAGLPKRVANLLRRQALYTRAQVADWYRANPQRAGGARGLGLRTVAVLVAWLDADAAAGAMTPDTVLRCHPREAVRWLRGRLGLSQHALALQLGAAYASVSNWETGRQSISRAYRVRLVPLLAPQLATEAGRAWLRALGWDQHAVLRPDELAGLPAGLATILHRNGLTTRAQVADWYQHRRRGDPLRGIGAAALAALAAWLGEAAGEEGDDDAG